MKSFYKLLLFAVTLISSQLTAQEYVKYETLPPSIIQQKVDYINGINVKYNIPGSGYLYLTLFKDNKPVGNCVKKVTRGKRIIKCDIFIWDGGKSITRKGNYEYRLEIYEGPENNFNDKITAAPVIKNVKVVKNL